MRQIIISMLVAVFGPIAAILLERHMTSAPEWIWRVASAGCILAGAVIAILSDPIYAKLKNPQLSPIVSTLLVATVACIVSAGIWWFSIIPYNQTTTVKNGTTSLNDNKNIVIQNQSFGNLKSRSIALSKEIMGDLCSHGWISRSCKQKNESKYDLNKMIDNGDTEGLQKWNATRAIYFNFRFVKRVIEIREEFSELHIMDQQLDDFLEKFATIQKLNKNLNKNEDIAILPQEIENVAERLVILAEQIK